MIPEIGKQYRGQYKKRLVVRGQNSGWMIGGTPGDPLYEGCELYWVYPKECPQENPTALIKQAQLYRRSLDTLTRSQTDFLLAMTPGQEHFCEIGSKFRLITAKALVSKGFVDRVGLGSGWITVRLSQKGLDRRQTLEHEHQSLLS